MNELVKNGWVVLVALTLAWFIATCLVVTVCVLAVPVEACFAIGLAWIATTGVYMSAAFGYTEELRRVQRGRR